MDVLSDKDVLIKCLDHGFVRLVDVMPRMVSYGRRTADEAIVQAARVSFGNDLKSIVEDEALIRYLIRHRHTTPLEMVEFKFHCKMPVFIARQWIRHRTANVNEISGRYSQLKDEFYIPEINEIQAQSKTNKQGGDGQVDGLIAADFKEEVGMIAKSLYEGYDKYIKQGISKEQSRMILSLNLYTEWYWKIDLHNLLHFLSLRCDSHAQKEMRVFAEAMLQLITPIVPVAVAAWNDYHPMRNAMLLTRLEVDALCAWFNSPSGTKCGEIDSINKREREEWLAKAKKLGIVI